MLWGLNKGFIVGNAVEKKKIVWNIFFLWKFNLWKGVIFLYHCSWFSKYWYMHRVIPILWLVVTRTWNIIIKALLNLTRFKKQLFQSSSFVDARIIEKHFITTIINLLLFEVFYIPLHLLFIDYSNHHFNTILRILSTLLFIKLIAFIWKRIDLK